MMIEMRWWNRRKGLKEADGVGGGQVQNIEEV
jgi:hypothetical protein